MCKSLPVENIAVVSSLTKLERGCSLESNEVRERSVMRCPVNCQMYGVIDSEGTEEEKRRLGE
jgi:hypothetical protein